MDPSTSYGTAQKHVKVALCCDKKEKGVLQVSRPLKVKVD